MGEGLERLGEGRERVAGVRYMGRLLVSLMAISQTDKCRDLSTFACFTPFSLRGAWPFL